MDKWIITIPRASARRARVLPYWEDARVFYGVDYKNLEAEGWQGLEEILLPQPAITASHAMLWKHLLTTDGDMWLILEDDAIPVSNFGEKLNGAMEEAKELNWDIIKLHTTKKHFAPRIPVSQSLVKLDPKDFISTAGVIMKRKTAEHLLKHLAYLPVDTFASKFCSNVLATAENLITLTGDSTYTVHFF